MSDTIENYECLIRSAFNGDVAGVRKMLEQGCDPNFVPEEGWTALHAAIENLELYTVSYLLDAGADPNLQGACQWTPLFHAVGSACDAAQQLNRPELDGKWVDIIGLLLLHGADAGIPSSVGYMARHSDTVIRKELAAEVARRYDRGELAALLEEAAAEGPVRKT